MLVTLPVFAVLATVALAEGAANPPAQTAPAVVAPKLPEAIEVKEAPPQPAVAPHAADLRRVSAALNRISTLSAEFTQIDVQGVSQGRFFLSRPGRLRFEYDPPSPVLVVANGETVLVRDNAMETVYRAKIDETPLRLLLKANVDLAVDARIIAVERQPGILFVTAEETEGYAQGRITFVFSDPELKLMRWIVTDPMGQQTTVSLRNQAEGVKLERKLFSLPGESTFKENL